MRDYMTLSVQNMTEKEIRLPEGYFMCRVELFIVKKIFSRNRVKQING